MDRPGPFPAGRRCMAFGSVQYIFTDMWREGAFFDTCWVYLSNGFRTFLIFESVIQCSFCRLRFPISGWSVSSRPALFLWLLGPIVYTNEPQTLFSDWVLRKPLIIEGSHLSIEMTVESEDALSAVVVNSFVRQLCRFRIMPWRRIQPYSRRSDSVICIKSRQAR